MSLGATIGDGRPGHERFLSLIASAPIIDRRPSSIELVERIDPLHRLCAPVCPDKDGCRCTPESPGRTLGVLHCHNGSVAID
jgi:hypothetical protein